MKSDAEMPYEEDRGRTHWDGCWSERGHHNCAVTHANTLALKLDSATQTAECFRGILRECCIEFDETSDGVMWRKPDSDWIKYHDHKALLLRLNTAIGLLSSIRNDAADLLRDGQPDARINRILSCATYFDGVVERQERKTYGETVSYDARTGERVETSPKLKAQIDAALNSALDAVERRKIESDLE